MNRGQVFQGIPGRPIFLSAWWNSRDTCGGFGHGYSIGLNGCFGHGANFLPRGRDGVSILERAAGKNQPGRAIRRDGKTVEGFLAENQLNFNLFLI
ncbi:MAG: hypothetical protein IIC64_05285 [SAR324 cluster bacterium]|nr:hypothetical protein [SAR324 cluster bacterium]